MPAGAARTALCRQAHLLGKVSCLAIRALAAAGPTTRLTLIRRWQLHRPGPGSVERLHVLRPRFSAARPSAARGDFLALRKVSCLHFSQPARVRRLCGARGDGEWAAGDLPRLRRAGALGARGLRRAWCRWAAERGRPANLAAAIRAYDADRRGSRDGERARVAVAEHYEWGRTCAGTGRDLPADGSLKSGALQSLTPRRPQQCMRRTPTWPTWV